MALSPGWKRLPPPAPASAAPADPAPPEPPQGLAALRWLLVEDERGTATVEMIVLIPVYVLLLMGLFAFGEMSMARQALAQAGRFHLWGGRAVFSDDQVKGGFFGPYHGTYTSQAESGDNTPWTLDDVTPQEVNLGGGVYREGERAGNPRNEGVTIALQALRNNTPPNGLPAGEAPSNAEATYGSGQIALKQRSMSATWQHQGITFGLNPTTSWRGRLFTWNPDHRRGEFQDGTQHHWVAHPALRPASGTMFQPAAWGNGERNRFLSPERTTGPSPGATQAIRVRNDGGDRADPGVWDVNARIDGSIPAEHTFYVGQNP